MDDNNTTGTPPPINVVFPDALDSKNPKFPEFVDEFFEAVVEFTAQVNKYYDWAERGRLQR